MPLLIIIIKKDARPWVCCLDYLTCSMFERFAGRSRILSQIPEKGNAKYNWSILSLARPSKQWPHATNASRVTSKFHYITSSLNVSHHIKERSESSYNCLQQFLHPLIHYTGQLRGILLSKLTHFLQAALHPHREYSQLNSQYERKLHVCLILKRKLRSALVKHYA